MRVQYSPPSAQNESDKKVAAFEMSSDKFRVFYSELLQARYVPTPISIPLPILIHSPIHIPIVFIAETGR